MILKTKCIQCGVEIEFKEKEIIRMTKEELKKINKSNQYWVDMLEETITEGIFIKKKVKKYDGELTKKLIKSQIVTPYGHIICPVCKMDQLFIKENL